MPTSDKSACHVTFEKLKFTYWLWLTHWEKKNTRVPSTVYIICPVQCILWKHEKILTIRIASDDWFLGRRFSGKVFAKDNLTLDKSHNPNMYVGIQSKEYARNLQPCAKQKNWSGVGWEGEGGAITNEGTYILFKLNVSQSIITARYTIMGGGGGGVLNKCL